ncbi:MAG: hypothetical protein O9346_15555 [Leptospiraceae bacterium]|jgi:hypothetical protein|nr:hypothetical protein [Leptospiraceae bacterium]MCZ8347828.1 hypothetical protein [Leptospiraceae bacterium]PJE04580.1 MAG: hypothetical protein CK427_02055 [Leptospira sp.]
MSLCYPDNGSVSCGSCCGVFNLNLTRKEITLLLFQRTEEFQNTVDFKISHSLPAYRQSREAKEKKISKKDESTYNCPFLGYLDGGYKMGCMIHPSRTGNPLSQNYSFYGSSICLGYQCRNRENPDSAQWKSIFQEISSNSLDYSQLSANHEITLCLELLFSKCKYPKAWLFGKYREFVLGFLNEYLKFRGIADQRTSFEIVSLETETLESLIKKLSKFLKKNSPSLNWLENLIT